MYCALQFDTNGDGEISTGELREAMRKLLGQQVSAFGTFVSKLHYYFLNVCY